MFKQLESSSDWFENRNIFERVLFSVCVFTTTFVVCIAWLPTSVGGLLALALVGLQGYFVWKESPKLLILSILLFAASWVVSGKWGWWSYNLASGLGLVALGIFVLALCRGPSFLDRLKWPESKVLLRPPF